MYKLGQTVQTRDIGKALYNENGVFEAISPSGERLRVECEAEASITSLVSLSSQGTWQLTKITEVPAPAEEEQPVHARARAAGQGRG
jgi:hypothetical protein